MSNDDNPTQSWPPSGDPTPEHGLGALAEPPSGATIVPADVSDPIDATRVMPVVPSLPAAAAPPPPPRPEPLVAAAPSAAPGTSEPWYRTPGLAAAALLSLLIVSGVVLFVVFSNRDADESDGVVDDVAPEVVTFVMTRQTSAGHALDTSMSATVVTPGSGEVAYSWVIPSDAAVGQVGFRQTDGTGRVEFRWAPVADADVRAWRSTVELAEVVATEGEQVVTGLAVDCSLERDGIAEPLIVESTTTTDDLQSTVGSYTFPNLQLIAGDRVDCRSTNVIADSTPVLESSTTVPATTVPASSSSIVEATATLPDASTATSSTSTSTTSTTSTSTTSTSTTSTTSTSTTTTSTTTSTTTLPPAAPALGDFLRGRPDLTEAATLLDRVGLLAELEAAGEPFTILVPTNEAIQAVKDSPGSPDFNDDDVVRGIFGAHLVSGRSLDGATIASQVTVAVSNGGPQPVDASGASVTIGGVSVSEVDNDVAGGVAHVLDGMLPVQA